MAFTLNTRKVNDVVAVDMSGQSGSGRTVLLLRNTVRRFMEDGTQKFVLNLGQGTYVDSSGLGELADDLHVRAQPSGRREIAESFKNR